VNDKNKEALKIAKHLTKLFPNKVTIQTPQDELELSQWKQLLDRDVEILKAKANTSKIQSVSIDGVDNFVHIYVYLISCLFSYCYSVMFMALRVQVCLILKLYLIRKGFSKVLPCMYPSISR
jgi:hypothetical protein